MSEPTVLMNEDAAEEALRFVRSQQPAKAVAASQKMATHSSSPAAATTAPIDRVAADLRRLLELKAEKEEHENALKPIATEIEVLTARILDRWAEDGVSSMKVNGATVYMRRSIYARILDREHVAEAMREAGLDSMLSPNTNTLSAWLREREENDEPIPPALDGIVGTYERFQLGVRNGRQ